MAEVIIRNLNRWLEFIVAAMLVILNLANLFAHTPLMWRDPPTAIGSVSPLFITSVVVGVVGVGWIKHVVRQVVVSGSRPYAQREIELLKRHITGVAG